VTEFPVTVEDAGAMVTATMRLPGCPPERALAAFTDPAALVRWWGGVLSAALTPGGPYIVRFPSLGAAMSGQVVRYEPASHLEFTWAWDHDPAAPRRTVLITVAGDAGTGGTQLTVVHGPHGDGATEATARAEHREGWEFFLPRLGALVSGLAPSRARSE
jgi:uncharacterized protein YndB with AHSA1/START domain